MIGYPLERLREEVAHIGYYFHWPYREIMQLDHLERRHWADRISQINKRLNEAAKESLN